MKKALLNLERRILLLPSVKRRLKQIIQWSYDERWFYDKLVPGSDVDGLDIKEAMSDVEAKALEHLASLIRKDGVMIAEVGSWKGFSTSVLARTVAQWNGSVFAVDHWQGNEGTDNETLAQTYDIYSIFRRNMIVLGVWHIVHPLVMDSQRASSIFADGILDMVFLDGDHRYEFIKNDIISWLPKLREGGILCGHDCEGYYSTYPEDIKKMIDKHIGDDYVSDIHPGVAKALFDCLKDRYSIMPGTRIWYIRKETNKGAK